MAKRQSDFSEDTDVLDKPKLKKPTLYRVILHNDDYTPMDFVVMILEDIFQKTHEESTHIMLTVHTKGAATCGIFPFAIAELKVKQVTEQAFRYKFPLRCSMEPE